MKPRIRHSTLHPSFSHSSISALTVLLIVIFSPRQISALENYALSVSPRFGMFYGVVNEIVYPHPLKGEDDYLSLLEWDIKPLWYYGLDLDFSRVKPLGGKGFFASLSLKNAIPAASGIMEDRDWLSKINNALTHYSVHDNFTEEIFWLDLAAGISIPLRPFVVLKPYFAFSYMRFVFQARDGSSTYARGKITGGEFYSIDDDPLGMTFNGKVISYTQQWFIPRLGLSAAFHFSRRFSTEASFGISPAIWLIDLDVHHKRDIIFTDYLTGGLFIEPRAVFSFAANQWISLSLESSYRFISKTRGASYNRSTADGASSWAGFFQEGEAGAGLSVVEAAFLVKIRL